jgi:hypothetical protein
MVSPINFIIIVLIIIVLVYLVQGHKCLTCSKESYNEPIYMNRAKLAYDWYPKSHHSIYGFPQPYGSHHFLAGLPYTDRAY